MRHRTVSHERTDLDGNGVPGTAPGGGFALAPGRHLQAATAEKSALPSKLH